MKSFLKALLVIAAILALLLVGGGVVAYRWWSKHGQEVVEEAKVARDQGVQFGEETDDQGCLDEALARHKKSPTLRQTIAHQLFLKGCLSASEQTDGFCKGVPNSRSRIASATWQARRCGGIGLGDPYCPQIFGQVQAYCESDLAEGPKK